MMVTRCFVFGVNMHQKTLKFFSVSGDGEGTQVVQLLRLVIGAKGAAFWRLQCARKRLRRNVQSCFCNMMKALIILKASVHMSQTLTPNANINLS